MTEQQRLALQIAEIALLNPVLGVDVYIYPRGSIVVLTTDPEILLNTRKAVYGRVEFSNPQAANTLHRLYEDLKAELEELK